MAENEELIPELLKRMHEMAISLDASTRPLNPSSSDAILFNDTKEWVAPTVTSKCSTHAFLLHLRQVEMLGYELANIPKKSPTARFLTARKTNNQVLDIQRRFNNTCNDFMVLSSLA